MNSIIPIDRPVTGDDIIALRDRLGISVSDMTWLLGISAATWGEITRERKDDEGNLKPSAVVADPTVALLARWLDAHVDDAARLIPNWPSPSELFRLLESLPATPAMGPIDRKRLGLSLGRDATTGSRWLRPTRTDSGTPANVDRLVYFLHTALGARGAEAWIEYRRLALLEANLRGEPNLDTAQGWPQTK